MAAEAGEKVLASGGNAVDAVVAAALAAESGAASCGIGGYGGHMTWRPGAAERSLYRFNSAAPASSRPRVRARASQHTPLSAGVPGTLGLQLALDTYGTRSFAESVAPAIRLVREGFCNRASSEDDLATEQLRSDPASEGALLSRRGAQRLGQPSRNPS
jgi:gamma-glutamyltranspeptidase/glutathione hydrolase